MIYWGDRVLTNVYKTIRDICPTVVSVFSAAEQHFPAATVAWVESTSVADDFSFEENAAMCGVLVKVVSKKSLEHAREIREKADGAMYRMGFKRTGTLSMGREESDPEIYRASARYRRVIGSDDTIPVFED